MQSFLPALQTLGSEFVLGYIQAVDGERDPRNLVTVFKSVATITRHLDFCEYSPPFPYLVIDFHIWLVTSIFG